MVALTGCTKDDVNYRTGVGLLKMNENEYSISKVVVPDLSSSYYGSYNGDGGYYNNYNDCAMRIIFYNEENVPIVSLGMTDFGLTSKTYTNGDGGVYSLGLSIYHGHYDMDDGSVVMIVAKSGTTYDIKITGKTHLERQEYTITYEGSIRSEHNR